MDHLKTRRAPSTLAPGNAGLPPALAALRESPGETPALPGHRAGWRPITRRSALAALSATLASRLMAQQARPVIQTRRLNNVRIAVSNLERSTAFYERLF